MDRPRTAASAALDAVIEESKRQAKIIAEIKRALENDEVQVVIERARELCGLEARARELCRKPKQ